jgi:plasmid stabilization system protein ParE
VSEVLPVELSQLAAAQVREAADWWRANRPKAPGAIQTEFETATSLLAVQPGVGARATNSMLPGVRRLHLSRIHYDLYYRVAEEPRRLQVLAFWHAKRGNQPPI